ERKTNEKQRDLEISKEKDREKIIEEVAIKEETGKQKVEKSIKCNGEESKRETLGKNVTSLSESRPKRIKRKPDRPDLLTKEVKSIEPYLHDKQLPSGLQLNNVQYLEATLKMSSPAESSPPYS
ncbi:hypothetical protein ILUMI_08952, partial [Ignelater luminosus]